MFGTQKKNIMYIDVIIPYEEENQLAAAYNRALDIGDSEWVLFLDHDVFLATNPRWYQICQQVLEELDDPKAAAIGCIEGGRKGPVRKLDDIPWHINESRKRWQKFGTELELRDKHIPGFFMLLKRSVAKEIGFRQQNNTINRIDIDFSMRLLEAGYHIYRMKGLYTFHRRGTRHMKGF